MSDAIDDAIEYHRGMNGFYADVLIRIRERLEALEGKKPEGVYWLIEVGNPTVYYCGDGDWCSNANHARKFASKDSAEARADSMKCIDPIRVVEHMWMKP